jgi:hypothetical protein
VGQNLIAIVAITLANEQPAILEEFKKLMINSHEVMQCH